MVVYARDKKGRFVSRPEGTRSRRGIGGRTKPGAIRYDNQRQAGGWVYRAFTDAALTKKQAYTIWRSRGGSKRYFERNWKQQHGYPKDATAQERQYPTRPEQARKLSLIAQHKAAERAGIPWKEWQRRHYRGMKLYWDGASREEWINEWYPQAETETGA